MDIWMTEGGKGMELAHWREMRAERARLDAAGMPPPDGHGYADPAIYPLTDRLNALPFLCTLQSCAGHRYPAADGEGDCIHNGQVWLWLARRASDRFRKFAPRLAADPLIEVVRVIYLPGYGGRVREVTDVQFKGSHDPAAFLAGVALVGDFFERLL